MLTARTIAPGTLRFEEAPLPLVRPGEALVRIRAVSLCGTDLHIFDGRFATELPLVQGHEMAGVVLETAPDSGTALRAGDRVAIDPLVSCGACRACRSGRGNVCADLSVLGCYEDGGFAEVLSVPVGRLHPVPDGLDLDVAALGEPTSISLQAVARADAAPGETALVLGCGPIGLLAALALAERGVTVIAVDTDPARVALAPRFGVHLAMLATPGFPDATQAARIAEWTDGVGPDIVIEATGVPASLENAVRLVAPAGRIVQVGISSRSAAITVKDLTDKEIDIRGSRNSRGLLPAGLDLLARHPEAADALLTHRFAFADLASAFHAMADPETPTGKIVILLPTGEEAAA